MIGLEILTSKGGKLWPSEYYKTLIDSLTIGGAIANPIEKYPEFVKVIEERLEERAGRYFLKNYSTIPPFDDVAIRLISIQRAKPGDELIRIGNYKLPITNGWQKVQVNYFGTIGNSKHEAESKRNRVLFTNALTNNPLEWSGYLSINFRLSKERKDRDLDNLLDAIAPAIGNKGFPIHCIVALKDFDDTNQKEQLRFSKKKINIELDKPR